MFWFKIKYCSSKQNSYGDTNSFSLAIFLNLRGKQLSKDDKSIPYKFQSCVKYSQKKIHPPLPGCWALFIDFNRVASISLFQATFVRNKNP